MLLAWEAQPADVYQGPKCLFVAAAAHHCHEPLIFKRVSTESSQGLCRLYREWEELQQSVMGERGRQVSAEEGALLRAKGLAALHALLQIVTDRVPDFIAPGLASELVTNSASLYFHDPAIGNQGSECSVSA